MDLQKLNDLTILAIQKVNQSRIGMDIYETNAGLKLDITTKRNSGKFVKRFTYEDGKVMVHEGDKKSIALDYKKSVSGIESAKTAKKSTGNKSQDTEDIQ